MSVSGAEKGNRTLAFRLGTWSSAIELPPRNAAKTVATLERLPVTNMPAFTPEAHSWRAPEESNPLLLSLVVLVRLPSSEPRSRRNREDSPGTGSRLPRGWSPVPILAHPRGGEPLERKEPVTARRAGERLSGVNSPRSESGAASGDRTRITSLEGSGPTVGR